MFCWDQYQVHSDLSLYTYPEPILYVDDIILDCILMHSSREKDHYHIHFICLIWPKVSDYLFLSHPTYLLPTALNPIATEIQSNWQRKLYNWKKEIFNITERIIHIRRRNCTSIIQDIVLPCIYSAEFRQSFVTQPSYFLLPFLPMTFYFFHWYLYT